MQNHTTHKSELGFTLIELLIVIAIIGILAAIAIPQFNQYKIRGYDTSAKQALRDVTLLCNAYWIDNDCSQECTLPKIMAAAYGFNLSSGLDVTLSSTSSQCSNFCASAKSNSSPNTFSIDSAALISSGSGCSGAGGSVQTASVSEDTNCTIRQRRKRGTGTSHECYYDPSCGMNPQPGDLIVKVSIMGGKRQLQLSRLFTVEEEHRKDAEEAEFYKSAGRSDEITNYCPVTDWEALKRYCYNPEGCTIEESKEEYIEKLGFSTAYIPIVKEQ